MKKIIIIFIAIILSIIVYSFTKDKNTNNSKLVVAEVTHSVFYAPWYVALENEYFKEEGLDIEVILTPGADKTATAVLSGDAQIGLSGLEATIYVYEHSKDDYLVNFSALTKRDGQFLVGPCKEKDNFKLNNLNNKTVLAGRVGGMPLMVFTYGLHKNGINITKVNIDSSVDFSALSGAFIGGNGDYVNLFEPNATNIEKNNYGCVLESIGLLAGELPYTAYYAKKSFIDNNKDIINKFNNAILKGLKFVHNNNSDIIASTIINQFPDTSLKDLTSIVQRYKDADSWWENNKIEEEAYNRLLEVMKFNDSLNMAVDYNILVTNEFN